MRYLSQGQEDKRIVELLLSLTKLKDDMQSAICDHLVRGFSISQAAMINDVKAPNLSAAINVINKVAETFEQINEIKTYDLCHTNK